MSKKAEDVYADALALSDEEQAKLRELLGSRPGGVSEPGYGCR